MTIPREQRRRAAWSRLAAALVAAAWLLGACESKDIPGFKYVEKLDLLGIPTLPCPKVRVLGTGNNYKRYRDGPGRDLTDIQIEAELANVTFDCKLATADGTTVTDQNPAVAMAIDLKIEMSAWRGPAATPSTVERIPYFVALVNRFGKVVDKKVFTAEIPFPGGAGDTPQGHHEDVMLRIPIRDLSDAFDYETVVSFQLTPEQLQETRAGAR